MGESHAPEHKCEEGVEERVGKFEMVGKEGKEVNEEGEDERMERAKQKVKLWLTNNFGEPDIIELMIPARWTSVRQQWHSNKMFVLFQLLYT